MSTAWQSNRLAHLAERINAEHESFVGTMRRGIEHAITAGNFSGRPRTRSGMEDGCPGSPRTAPTCPNAPPNAT